jgi:3-methylfumaryl-CoA hydratase
MTASNSSIDLARLRQWIGRSEEAEDIATPALVERFCTTLLPHLASFDDAHTPLGIHWCLAPRVAPISALGRDGHPALGDFLPPVPLSRRMWAGGEIEFLAAIPRGGRVVRRSVIADVVLKQGRSGPLCFVSVRHEYATEDRVAISERQDIVFRDEPRSEVQAALRSSQQRHSSPAAGLIWTISPSSVLLFRYSALTFNGHRIHYDHPYATEVEGYPGLVVHGPLQATLLLNAAATILRQTPRRFSYRNLAPIFADTPFLACAAQTAEGQVECWVEDARKNTAMQATATS